MQPSIEPAGQNGWLGLDCGGQFVRLRNVDAPLHDRQVNWSGCRPPWKVVVLHPPMFKLGDHAEVCGHAFAFRTSAKPPQ
jgi:hypothetical protein